MAEVLIEDPYIRAHHQIVNLLRFIELVIRKCGNVRKIHLVTGCDNSQDNEQMAKLREIANQLKALHKIEFSFEISSTLHDRQIK